MLTRAASDLDLDLERSFVVGDAGTISKRDRRSAREACSSAPATAARRKRSPKAGVEPAAVVDNLIAAVSWILRAVLMRRAARRRSIRAACSSSSTASPARASAVFGDLIVDEFIYGEIARVSREAPVLILNYDSTEIVPGGAGNAASNVAALGGAAVAVGVDGTATRPGARLLDAMRGRVDVRGVVRPRGFRTPTKTRILAGGIHSAKQQVVRIDRAAGPQLADAYQRAIAATPARGGGRLRRAAGVRLRQRARDAGAGRAGAEGAAPPRPAARRRCWSTRATRCCGSAA